MTLVAHAFYAGVDPELASYAARFPPGGDQLVTHSPDLPSHGFLAIREAFPKAQFIPVPNAGQDVGADLRFDCDVILSAHHANIASAPVFHDGRDLGLGLLQHSTGGRACPFRLWFRRRA